MKAHGINMRGEFEVERVPTLPTWTSADEGREIYVEDEEKKYYGGDSDWIDYSVGNIATTTDSYMAILPLKNTLPDNGRFSGLDAGNAYNCDDGSNPFSQGVYFNPYNGGSIAQCGKFIYNNNDYGGSAGAMTQTTIDLLETQTLRSTNKRYGIEYRIAELTAGSGTASPRDIGGSTRYLMSTNVGAWHGIGGWTTFGMWVRCSSGEIGIGWVSYPYFSIDGVDYSYTDLVLTTSDNWIFVLASIATPRGYSNGLPSLYANNGNKVQVALPAVFTGLVRGAYWEAPIINNF